MEVWDHSVSGHTATSSLLGVKAFRLSRQGPGTPPYELEPAQPTAGVSLPSFVPPRFNATPKWCRNINLLAITYAFRPRLRYRLTHGRMILPQETLGLRRQGFSPCLSLLMPAYSLPRPWSTPHGVPCICLGMLPYRCPKAARSFGIMLEPRYIFGADSLDQ